jgi:hypothetical protein
MKERIKIWWDSAVRLAELMDSAPVSLETEVARLQQEVRALRDEVNRLSAS